MAVTYFGNTGTPDTACNFNYEGSRRCLFNNPAVSVWTCPGTGAQSVKSLEARVYMETGTANARLSIYLAADSSFVMQGSAELLIDNGVGTSEWADSPCVHTTFVDQGGSPIANPQLTGGTAYILVGSGDDSGSALKMMASSTPVSGGCLIDADYTGGFPATLGAGSAWDYTPAIRCGVEPAAAGPSAIARRKRFNLRMNQRMVKR